MARGEHFRYDSAYRPAASRRSHQRVNGKTQTHLPWDSWQCPYVLMKPTVWFHDVFYEDGRPYREHEVMQIRDLTSYANGKGR
jgi:hypothetical protein